MFVRRDQAKEVQDVEPPAYHGLDDDSVVEAPALVVLAATRNVEAADEEILDRRRERRDGVELGLHGVPEAVRRAELVRQGHVRRTRWLETALGERAAVEAGHVPVVTLLGAAHEAVSTAGRLAVRIARVTA